MLAMSPGASATADEVTDTSSPFLIRSWQTDQGLPNNTVNAIVQTHDGYLWLGTDEGLARFDGVRCQVFGLQDGLINLQISALLEDRRHALWIGTSGGGLGRYEHGRISICTVKDGLAGDSISGLLEDANGDIWIGTHTGLSRWHDGKFETMASELGPMLTFGLARDAKGNIYVATLHNGLLRFHDGAWSVADSANGQVNNNPRCVFVDSQDRVWAGTREYTLLCGHDGTWTKYGTNEGFPRLLLYGLAETEDGTIWAGSWNDGLYYFRNGTFKAIRKADGLSDESILSLCSPPHEKFLWVGTQSGGLNRIGDRKLAVYHVMEGAKECRLRAMAEAANGELWVGTYGQGIFQWQGQDFVSLLESPYGGHLLVETMMSGRDGSLWWGAGPAIYQRKNGKLGEYYGDRPWLSNDRVWCLCEDRTNGVWVGTYNGKVGWLGQGKFTQIKAISGKPITALAQEKDGTLWVASLGHGLARWQGQKLTTFTTRDGLQSDLVRTLLLDGDGVLWIGTDGGGLNRWSGGRLAGFSMLQGLPDNTVSQILEDDDGCLWLGCNRGICRVSKRVLNDVAGGRSPSVHSMMFDLADGMASQECMGNFGAAMKTRSGLLCFATAKGVVVIDPRQQRHGATISTALLEDLRVDHRVLTRAGGAGDEAQTNVSAGLPVQDLIQIEPGRHGLEFHYTGINFDAPERIQFRYRLDGLDNGWTEAGNVRVARYSYVPPGTYHFHVQASNGNGEWNEPGATIAFAVQPYFWQTTAFWVLGSGAVMVCLALVIRLVERRRYRARLKRLEQEQAMERERVRIAQDLHDELGSSLTYISMSISDLSQSREEDAGRLKSRLEKVSDFAVRTARALDEIVWAVNPRNDSLRSLLEYLTQLARELFEDTGVRCRFQIPEELPAVPLPPEMRHHLFLTIKEALNNALKHAHAGEIVLGAKISDATTEIFIQDNGVGFDPAALPEGGEHDGLKNMRQRIEALGGQFEAESRPGGGTTIRLTLSGPSGYKAESVKSRK